MSAKTQGRVTISVEVGANGARMTAKESLF